MRAGSTAAKRGYWPQLDGVRAIGICAVVAFHLGYLPGGWVGVDIFFVLSGYLITTILIGHGGSFRRLASFWGGRVRRLLPAVLTVLFVLSAYAWFGGPGVVPSQLRSPALATLFYQANWQQIEAGHNYFAAFTAPSPVQHTWSLAIEEQYYLLWPLLLGSLVFVTRRLRIRWHREALVASTVTLAVLSAVWMGFSAHLFGANRAYLGTDTRAWELLLGGAMALLWPPGRAVSQRASRNWNVLAGVGAVGVLAGILATGGPPTWVWDGGLVGIAVCAGLLIVGSVRVPNNPVARFLTLGPVRWLGIISYSLYIWHWPVIVLMTPTTTGLSGLALLAARLAAMLVAACGSYYLIEHPLRTADWSALTRRLRVPAVSFVSVGLVVMTVLIVGGTVGPRRAESAVVSMATLPSQPAQDGQPRLDLPLGTPAHPYRVWILGDSVMADASLGVKAALEATGEMTVVANSAFPGWGLTTDRAWPGDAERTIATYHPQIVIGTWSWDDNEAATTPARYRQRLTAALGRLLAPGNGVQAVVLLQFPKTGPPSATETSGSTGAWTKETRMQDAWDDAARLATAAFPGHAWYLTTSQLFAPAGRFYTWFRTPSGSWIRARKLDNTHFCPYGAAEFGALITKDLSAQLHLASLSPGWELGRWVRDPRYNDPPGACPADQPPAGYQGIPVPG
jgi:peptidoglycan/LPS O-acetylase OafA/YrhL